jgi:hypothetical protein
MFLSDNLGGAGDYKLTKEKGPTHGTWENAQTIK